MKTLIATATALCLACSVHAAETGSIVETFACNLKSGKTLADFDAAAAFWNEQMEKLPESKSYFAALMVPFRANSPYDVIWVGSNPNLNDWAKSASAYSASEAGRAADARFDSVATCKSGLYFSSPLHEGLPVEDGDTESAIEGYACTLLPGKKTADVEAVNSALKTATAAISATDPTLDDFSIFQWTPWLANTPADLFYLTVNDDLVAFGRSNTAWMTSKEGQAAEATVARTMTCESGLYTGKLIRRPAPPQQ